MLRFTTLGATGLSESGDTAGAHPILAQPKRLALLAYLAVGHPDSLVPRDTLLAMFWPEFERATRDLIRLLASTGSRALAFGRET